MKDEVLHQTKIVLICDSKDNYPLSSIYKANINKKKTTHMSVMDWRGVHKISCSHPYTVFKLLNITLESDLTSIVFPFENSKEATSS